MTANSKLRWTRIWTSAMLCGLAALYLAGGCPPVDPNDPNQSTVDPNDNTGDPNDNTGDPNDNTGDPNQSTGDPNQSTGDPNQNTGDPNQGGTQPTPPPTSFLLQSLAATGDQVPGQPTGVTFTRFGNPVIDSSGRVAFWALYSGTGARGYGGIYVWDTTQLIRIIDDDPNSAAPGTVPGRTDADYFGKYGGTGGTEPLAFDLTWGPGNRLMFVAQEALDGTQGIYRWRATDGNLARATDRFMMPSAFSDASDVFQPTLFLPGVDQNGFLVFGCTYLYFTKPPSSSIKTGRGVFRSDGQTITAMADTNVSQASPGHVPDQGADAFFQNINTSTTINASGDYLYQGSYLEGNGNNGVYMGRGTTGYRVIDNRPGVTWPGLPSGAQFNPNGGQPRFAIGPSGHLALSSSLLVGSTTQTAVILWDRTTNNWAELTGPNSAPASSLLSGVNEDGQVVLVSNSNPYLCSRSARQQLNGLLPTALLGSTITWTGANGASVNNHGRAVVSYKRDTNGKGLVYWNGSQLLLVADVGAGVPENITGLTILSDPQRDRPGMSGVLNDDDEIVFRVVRTAGAEAIYLARGQ